MPADEFEVVVVIDPGQGVFFAAGLLAALQMGATALRAVRRGGANRREEAIALEDFLEHAGLAAQGAVRNDPEEAAAWRGFRKFRVARKVAEAHDIYSYYLAPADGRMLPRFEPGQHLTFELHVPDQSRPVVRCYSLSDAPGDTGHYRITVRRQGAPPGAEGAPDGLASCFLQDKVEEGDVLDVKAPSGHFYLDANDPRPLALVAGGVGITPMVSMLNAVVAARSKRKVWLFYGMTDRSKHAFADHLAQIDKANKNVKIVTRFSRADGADWKLKGRVTVDLLKQELPGTDCVFYICGPAEMMQGLTNDLQEWGTPREDIHFEAFGASTAKLRAADKKEDAGGDGAEAPTVSFAKSGKSVKWTSGFDVILDAAEENGVRLQSGCRAGQCGSCRVRVKDGKVRHLVEPGVPLEEGECLACVAAPDGDLVIDA